MAASKPAWIGGFLLGGVALGVAAILLFGSLRLFRPLVEAVVFFQGSVTGLTVGAPVTFRGVRVGAVRRVALRLDVGNLTARIPVYITLNPRSVSMVNGALPVGELGVERMLAAGLKAQLNTASFVTGQLQIDLDLRPDITIAPTGIDLGVPEIPAIPSELETLKHQVATLQLNQLVDSSLRTLNSIQHLSDQLDGKIGPMIDSLQRTSDTAHDTLQAATDAVRQVQASTTRTLGDIDALAVDGRQQLAARGAELSHILADADRTARQAESLSATLNDFTSPRSQTRNDLEAAIRDLAASAASLRNFSREIERNPSTVLTGRASQ